MQRLITAQDFGKFKDVGKKLDTQKINECITEAQMVDLFDYLDEFLFDVVENREDPTYADLMNGSSFVVDGLNYSHIGLKAFLADLTYPRFIYKVNVNLTPFGAVQKLSQDSSPVDRNVLKDIAKQTQIDADIKFKAIRKYLEINKSLFPRYNSGSCSGGNNPNIHTFSQRFSKL